MRATIPALLTLLVAGCGAAASPDGEGTTPRVWVEESSPLPHDARAFTMGAKGDRVLVTPIGTWNEPLDVEGVVLSSGRRRHGGAIPVRVPEWRGQNELALRVGDDRLLLQYDAPAAAAPVEPGELVRVVAHSMSDGPKLGFSLAVLGPRGDARLIGLRSSDPASAMLPEGWSVEPGPVVRWMCGPGRGPERGVLVRGPGGEIVAEPGRTAVAALGPGGTRYAVDLVVERPAHATCDTPEGGQLSVVVRRVDQAPAPSIEAGSRASL